MKILSLTAALFATIFVTVQFASAATPPFQVSQGGTGWGNIQANSIPYGNGTGRLATTTQGTAGYVLAWLNGIPAWAATSTLSTITGTLSNVKGGTGQDSSAWNGHGAINAGVWSALSTTSMNASITGLAGTATALAADGADCSAGAFPLGVNASGAVVNCTDAWTEAENTSAAYLSTVDISANTNLARTWPIILTGDTLSFGGLATSSAISAASGLLYATGVNTLASISTSSAISMSITGLAGTATALAANGANCSAGQYPLGMDASGAVEDCTAVSAGSVVDPFTHPAAGQSATTSLMLFNGAASSTLLSAYKAYFGGTATSTFDAGGVPSFPLTGILQGKGAGTNVGVISDSSTVGQVLRVTGASTYAWGALDLADADAVTGDLPFANLAQISANSVFGNITGATADGASVSTSSLFAATNGQVLGRVNGTWTGTATTTFSTGLTYANGAVTCTTGTASVFGCLPAADFTTFNAKQAPGFQIATTTVPTFAIGNLAYLTGTTPTSIGGIATGTVSGTNGITVTASRAAIGGALAIDCIVASGSAAGCLSLTDWTTFNNKGSGTVTSIVAGDGLLGGTITTSGTLYGQISTSTLPVISNIPYFTSVGSATAPAKLANVATTTLTASGVLSLSQPVSVIGTSASALTVTGGTNGQVLAWSGGVPAWVATTTLSTISGTLANSKGGTGTDSSGFTGVAVVTAGTWTAIGAQTCTNQFVRAMSAAYVATCASVADADITGQIGVAHGGTGAATFTSGQLLYGNGTNALSSVATTSLAVGASISSSGTLGAQVGGTATTFSLNMANANSWTANQTFTSASTTALSTTGWLGIPNASTTPTLVAGSNTAGIAVDSKTASSSLRYADGAATRALYPDSIAGLPFASSTLAYRGAYGAAGTTTILLMRTYRPLTLLNAYCDTDVGTAVFEIGTGTATSSGKCAAGGTLSTFSANNTWNMGQAVYIGIGTNASAPNIITVSPDIRKNAD